MPHAIDPRTLGVVVLGGAVGVLVRAALTVPASPPPAGDASGIAFTAVPWVTLAVNVVGSLLLGFVIAALGTDFPRWRAFLGTGVLGGFTTYSAFAVHAVEMTATPLFAVVLVVASVVLGLLAARIGVIIGRVARPVAAEEQDVPE
ncbi:CrcB family protein [Microbacterium sp. C7(2022)]|uniref:fluoride efflux transporter FluC n=1 Tax=Microbacterium sp. C7(2022) TaxID=2992759 RepID=UPI00237C40CE|nr:CrcB family protein [Microbacterium sp. C7(2022)]MDE0545112.1 CrcB family protein [Microbacterium sp. C7(2022)]